MGECDFQLKSNDASVFVSFLLFAIVRVIFFLLFPITTDFDFCFSHQAISEMLVGSVGCVGVAACSSSEGATGWGSNARGNGRIDTRELT